MILTTTLLTDGTHMLVSSEGTVAPRSYVPALMEEAFKEARAALAEGEVPVGCVLVHEALNKQLAEAAAPHPSNEDAALTEAGQAVLEAALVQSVQLFHGRNATNRCRHALAHAEYIAVEALTAHLSSSLMSHSTTGTSGGSSSASIGAAAPQTTSPGLTPLSDFVLYVTVEPCIMCASMLLYNRIGQVYYGTGNPRFGGNGTVLALHDATRNQYDRRQVLSEGMMGDNAEAVGVCGYDSEGGHRADDAIQLLQWFYERENPNAPGHKRRRKTADTDVQ